MRMLTFYEWAKAEGIDLTPDFEDGSRSMAWFIKRDLPMVCECCQCNMSCVLVNMAIDESTKTYCRKCSGILSKVWDAEEIEANTP